jgi:GT2 family glycosyltransferase
MKLGVIILNWNDAKGTTQCLRMVQGWSDASAIPVVVDNASEDESVQQLVAEFPDLDIVRNSKNMGFSGGCNSGLKRTQELGCEAVLLLSSDATLTETSLIALFDAMGRLEQPAIIGPAISELSARGSVLTYGGRDIARYSRTRISSVKDASTLDNTRFHEVDYVPGTCLLMPISIYESVGPFDADYFFSGEAADFCTRARRLGIPSLIDPSIIVCHGHECGDSHGLRETLYLYYSLRNRFLYVDRNMEGKGGYLRVVWSIKALLMFGLSLAKGDCSRARAVALALCHGISRRWGDQNACFNA